MAYGPVDEIAQSTVAANLEGAFLNLAEDIDATHVAQNIVATVTATA